MLTPSEQKNQAALIRRLAREKLKKSNQGIQARSGNVPCYLNSLTDSKLAKKGFYLYCSEADEVKLKKLAEQLYGYTGDVEGSNAPIVRITKRP